MPTAPPQVAIVTDSAADLPGELAGAHGIAVVPLDVRLGALGPATVQTMHPEEFWRACATSDLLPETAAPSPGAFHDAFAAALAEGASSVLCVTISSELSATHQAAQAGAAELGPGAPVVVIDSRSATMGEGLVVLEAADCALAGGSLAECTAAARAAIGRVQVVGTLDTLDNLRRGGRIGAAQALLGSVLAIKPVIEVRDGAVQAESRQRTRARSLRYLVDKVAALAPLDRLAVVHAAAPDLENVLAMLEPVHPRADTVVTFIGPVIGAHTGAGTVGLCFLPRR